MSSLYREKAWIIEIQHFFNHEEEDNITRPVSIFNVPKILKSIKPEAYTPQMIALGPYYHCVDSLYEMEHYKRLVAKKACCIFNTSANIEDIVSMLSKADFKIRAWYHKRLSMDSEALSWLMAIDGLFLLQFLQIYIDRTTSVIASSTRMSFLVDSIGKKIAYDCLLKDIMMLENQIPIFVLKRIFRIQCGSSEIADGLLPAMFVGICKEIAPLELKEDYPQSKIVRCAHLLDLLYQLIVPMLLCDLDGQDDSLNSRGKSKGVDSDSDSSKGYSEPKYYDSIKMEKSTKVFEQLWDRVFAIGIMKKMQNALPFRFVKAFEPVFSMISSSLGLSNEKSKHSINGSRDMDNNKEAYCKVEQIMLPSITELSEIGVEFCPTNEQVPNIKFDAVNKKFYLPKVNLDVNSEVILRNLVAYEASAISGPLIIARYTELMNGIVDTSEDVKILARRGIIKSQLGYEEVANLWNGMSKSIRLSRVDFIDEAIEGVNTYYNGITKVKFYMKAKIYAYESWRMLVLLATLLVIGLMCIQSFCSVYNCPRTFHLE